MNWTCIGCRLFGEGLAPARRAKNTHQEPDRDHDHRAEQEIAPQPVDGIEAEVPQPLKQHADAMQDVPGIEADRGEHHADQDRQQDQPERHRQRRAAEKAVQAFIIAGRQIPDVVGHRYLLAGAPAHYRSGGAHGEPALRRQWLRGTQEPQLVATVFNMRSSVSSRSASRGGLSQRSRLMRGNRIATPDLCRGERANPSKATSSTSPWSGSCTTWRTGPNFSVVLRRTKRSICNSSSSVKPK